MNKKKSSTASSPKTQQNTTVNIFIITSTKRATFMATKIRHHMPYGIALLARLSIPHYQKTWKVQCKLREVNVIH